MNKKMVMSTDSFLNFAMKYEQMKGKINEYRQWELIKIRNIMWNGKKRRNGYDIRTVWV